MRAMDELARASWRKATRSQGNGACVEVAALNGQRIAIRDSKDASGAALIVAAEKWRTLLASWRAGRR
jgi:hypothetical protein